MGNKKVTESYLDMMEESLKEKIRVLEDIMKENEAQKEILESDVSFDEAGFDEAISRKGELIRRVENLNDGFESLYERVREELQNNKEKYKQKINTFQDLIRQITDLSSSIEAGEKRNRALAKSYFSSSKEQINTHRRSSQAALDYYLTMNKSKITPPQFYDTKN
ncbi:flagellar protein FliT [Butyrivibrio sp. AE3004]|uniref:flagellar protein FliT n=1 Tax=Butyrivibrio sp. AE3004 TaxID=1506994 RepID=UPI0018CC3992|nr:flagellar protein FliT [Butyrivibrio sp. AE3004]